MPAPAVSAIPPDLARRLQVELKRVGCDPGATNGKWDESSRLALNNFNRYARTTFDTKVASLDALESVRSTKKRACPCDSGYALGSDGACHKHNVGSKTAKRSATHKTGGGSRCLSFGGRLVCQ